MISPLVRRLRHSFRCIIISFFRVALVDELVSHMNLSPKFTRSRFDIAMDDEAIVIVVVVGAAIATGTRN